MQLFLNQNPLFRVGFIYIFAVFTARNFISDSFWIFSCAFLVLSAISLVFLINKSFKKKSANRWIIGIVFLSSFYFFGVSRYFYCKPNRLDVNGKGIIEGKICSIEGKSKQWIKVGVKVTTLEVSDKTVNQPFNAFVYFPDSAQLADSCFGIPVRIEGIVQSFQNSVIPYQFDYSQYLLNNGYSCIFYAQNIECMKSNSVLNLDQWINKIRSKFRLVFRTAYVDSQNSGFIEAMILGDRSFLDKDLKQAYAKSGVIHILAVSGLHVGILYLMVVFFINILIPKKFKYLKFFIVVFVLLFYAWLTGFSPSVSRAVIMFSLIMFGDMQKLKASFFNTLAASALIISIVDPLSVFNVGFWLSHLAVAGIFVFYPFFRQLINFQFIGWRWIYELVCVSLSAQIMVLPILIYSFNTFSTYFLLGNLIVLPLIPAILFSSFLLLILPQGSFLFKVIAGFSNGLVTFSNDSVNWIASLSGSFIERLSLSITECLVLFIFFISIGAILHTYKKIRLQILILSIFTFFGMFSYRVIHNYYQRNAYIIINKNGAIVNVISGIDNWVYVFNNRKSLSPQFYLSGTWAYFLTKKPEVIIRSTKIESVKLKMDNQVFNLGDLYKDLVKLKQSNFCFNNHSTSLNLPNGLNISVTELKIIGKNEFYLRILYE